MIFRLKKTNVCIFPIMPNLSFIPEIYLQSLKDETATELVWQFDNFPLSCFKKGWSCSIYAKPRIWLVLPPSVGNVARQCAAAQGGSSFSEWGIKTCLSPSEADQSLNESFNEIWEAHVQVGSLFETQNWKCITWGSPPFNLWELIFDQFN